MRGWTSGVAEGFDAAGAGSDSLLAGACVGSEAVGLMRPSSVPFPAMSTPEVIEAIVGPDGALVVSADELERVGAHAGDRVRVETVSRRRIRSMLGAGADAMGPPDGFKDADLRALRREMGDGFTQREVIRRSTSASPSTEGFHTG